MEETIRSAIAQWLPAIGTHGLTIDIIYSLLLFMVTLGLAALSYLFTQRVVIKAIKIMILHSKTTWDNTLITHNVLEKFSLLVPLLVLDVLRPLFPTFSPLLSAFTQRFLNVAIVLLLIRTLYAMLNSVADISAQHKGTERLPVVSFIQLIKLFLFFVAAIIIISILSGRSPVYFLSGLGVATGFIMLIFKDAILGFVAGIQISINRMVNKGDWIQMDPYGANGTVEEISLTTVKIRNFDQTLIMLPAYALISNSFKNWRGMSEAGGRRIMRSVFIDIQSIAFLTTSDLERLANIRQLKNYLAAKIEDVNTHNAKLTEQEFSGNSRHITNIGAFRAYLQEYLNHYPQIRKDLTLMVRQLASSPQGLPIEIYIFSAETRWELYEGIQGDIFDHIFSVLPLFGLRAYQQPAGYDMQNLFGQKQS